MPLTGSGFEEMSQTHSECPFSIHIEITLPAALHKCVPPQQADFFSLVSITKMEGTCIGKYLLSADGAVIVFTLLLLFSKHPIEALGMNSPLP